MEGFKGFYKKNDVKVDFTKKSFEKKTLEGEEENRAKIINLLNQIMEGKSDFSNNNKEKGWSIGFLKEYIKGGKEQYIIECMKKNKSNIKQIFKMVITPQDNKCVYFFIEDLNQVTILDREGKKDRRNDLKATKSCIVTSDKPIINIGSREENLIISNCQNIIIDILNQILLSSK